METQIAKLNYLRIAPRKVRSVGDLIKGLSVNNAEAQFMVERRRPAKALLKLLRSAVAGAKNNKHWDANHLFIVSVRVDQGPMLKRMLPRARGSASPIQKKMSNVVITLGLNEKLKSKFTIVVPKKVKTPPGGDKPTKRKKPREGADIEKTEAMKAEVKSKAGFFKRVFNRKAGVAK
jgi:large subunit ribosomal protein L22